MLNCFLVGMLCVMPISSDFTTFTNFLQSIFQRDINVEVSEGNSPKILSNCACNVCDHR